VLCCQAGSAHVQTGVSITGRSVAGRSRGSRGSSTSISSRRSSSTSTVSGRGSSRGSSRSAIVADVSGRCSSGGAEAVIPQIGKFLGRPAGSEVADFGTFINVQELHMGVV